jgi:hypothetical protein
MGRCAAKSSQAVAASSSTGTPIVVPGGNNQVNNALPDRLR